MVNGRKRWDLGVKKCEKWQEAGGFHYENYGGAGWGERLCSNTPHSSTQFHTLLHSSTPSRPDLPCPNVNSKIPLYRPESQDPYSGAFWYTVLYGKIPRPLQRGICCYMCVSIITVVKVGLEVNR
jgi:hypothetical protein